MRQQGLIRVEVQVRKEHAGLVREVASALRDPNREAETSNMLRRSIAVFAPTSLKDILASAPLENLDLKRPRDVGREIEI